MFKQKTRNSYPYPRLFACLLAAVLIMGLLPGRAMAASYADTFGEDSYITISEAGYSVEYRGAGMGNAVLGLKPDTTYHITAVFNFRSDGAVEVAENVQLSPTIDEGWCAAGDLGGIAVNLESSNAGSIANYLYYEATEDIELWLDPTSFSLESDGSSFSNDRDANNNVMTNTRKIAAGNIADGGHCKLEFDVLAMKHDSSKNDPDENLVPDEGSDGILDASENPSPEESEMSSEEPDPRLPEVYKGAVMTDYRTTYHYDSRPEQIVLNAISNDPNWGNELNFLHLIDLETGEEYRQGTVQLTAGKAYRLEIVVHNASTKTMYGTASDVALAIEMPPTLPGGSLGTLSATLSASNTVPVSVSASLGLYCDQSVKLMYSDDSATYQSAIGGSGVQLDYKDLFTDGAAIGNVYANTKGGSVTFVIQAVADETIPLASGADRLSDPIFATPYTKLEAGPVESVDPESSQSEQPTDDPATNDGDATKDQSSTSGGALFVVFAIAICFVACMLYAKPSVLGITANGAASDAQSRVANAPQDQSQSDPANDGLAAQPGTDQPSDNVKQELDRPKQDSDDLGQ